MSGRIMVRCPGSRDTDFRPGSKDGHGVCPECGREVRINADGSLRGHQYDLLDTPEGRVNHALGPYRVRSLDALERLLAEIDEVSTHRTPLESATRLIDYLTESMEELAQKLESRADFMWRFKSDAVDSQFSHYAVDELRRLASRIDGMMSSQGRGSEYAAYLLVRRSYTGSSWRSGGRSGKGSRGED
jgi:hypothetical protein